MDIEFDVYKQKLGEIRPTLDGLADSLNIEGLRSELERIWAKGNTILFDVDVKGGLRLKSIFGDRALAIFVMPPSVEELRRRLVGRATDAPEVIEKRVAKAETEISYAEQFDKIIINDILEEAVAQTEKTILEFTNRS